MKIFTEHLTINTDKRIDFVNIMVFHIYGEL